LGLPSRPGSCLLMKFVSRSVMTGFVNALAILIFLAQLPQLLHVGGYTYAMVTAGFYLFPLLTKRMPALVRTHCLDGLCWRSFSEV
jgi:sulfate permease, SulP family